MKRKRCANCKKNRLVKFFYRSSKSRDGRQSWCKTCVYEYDKSRSQLPERKEAMRKASFKKHHGSRVSYKFYRAIMAFPCRICGLGRKDGLKMVLDHDHQTGEFRGPLCNRCNLALGAIQDDIGWLERAKQYLSPEELVEA